MSSNVCLKCGTATNEPDDLHCRKIFIEEIDSLIKTREMEKAKILFLSAVFDEDWKHSLIKRLGKEFNNIVVSAELEITTKIRHQKFLNDLGITYLGVSIPGVKRHRVTHCYNCQKDLDNTIDIECNKCHWMVCSCGACGCGHVGIF